MSGVRIKLKFIGLRNGGFGFNNSYPFHLELGDQPSLSLDSLHFSLHPVQVM